MNTITCDDRKNMMALSVTEIVEATGGRLISPGTDSFTGVSIDSRKIQHGELFIALKGDRFDGHDFLPEALRNGSGAIVSRPPDRAFRDKTIISVSDTLKALQDVGRRRRCARNIPAVAITGSNGKTTTKELISSILGTRYRVLKNAGNLNNHIGLPLSLTRITGADEVIVLEMGASGPGEIRQLCGIAVPDYGVLTNISHAHLEGFGDIATVRKTKLELLESVSLAVVNADDDFLMEGLQQSGFQGKLIRYGIKNPSDIYASDIELKERGSRFVMHAQGRTMEISPQISGMFNISNLLAAAAVGFLFDIAPESIKEAIEFFTGVPMRLEVREVDGVKVISDVYNANPASMEEAVKELVRNRKGRVIAVLGDMLELGTYEEEAHRKLGRLMSDLRIDIFLAVGRCMSVAASEFRGEVHRLQTSAEAAKVLRDIREKGDTVLIKGSRGMRMEKVLEE